MTRKIAIIGAGKRVRQTILPAIWSLTDRVEIVQIRARTAQTILLPDGTKIYTRIGLDDLSLREIDILIVAVGTNAIQPVLKNLRTKGDRSGVSLIMDTPPLRFSHLWRIATFKGFKRVEVGEDWPRLSPIIAAKEIIDRGGIGQVRSILLDHMGYRYHGMATMKALAGANTISAAQRQKADSGKFETTVSLGKDISAKMLEPRDYPNGCILISGTDGMISIFRPNGDPDCKFEISYSPDRRGWHQPITINGTPHPTDDVEDVLASLPFDYLTDNSRINLLKIRGYARLLEDVVRDYPCYAISDALYDYLAVVLTEKTGRFRDLSLSDGQNSMIRRMLNLHRR